MGALGDREYWVTGIGNSALAIRYWATIIVRVVGVAGRIGRLNRSSLLKFQSLPLVVCCCLIQTQQCCCCCFLWCRKTINNFWRLLSQQQRHANVSLFIYWKVFSKNRLGKIERKGSSKSWKLLQILRIKLPSKVFKCFKR